MLKKILLTAAVLLVALLGYAATRPDSFEVQRSTRIHASPEKVAALIGDFHHWSTWSPWEKLDPEMRRTHSGAPSGVGAIYAWEGNRKVGAGRMEITDASPTSTVVELDFLKPFESHSTAEFTLHPDGDFTEVVWKMRGPMPYLSKVMTVFMDMDRMIGQDFEAGLADLKAAAEAGA